jgi:hypothetical protein
LHSVSAFALSELTPATLQVVNDSDLPRRFLFLANNKASLLSQLLFSDVVVVVLLLLRLLRLLSLAFSFPFRFVKSALAETTQLLPKCLKRIDAGGGDSEHSNN